MRRTICALMLLGAIGGCGSDDEELVITADRQPPTVAITAVNAAEGGETVPISVTVTDNVDSGLTPTIACSGGTLTGTMLIAPLVTSATNITCTATAVDKAGNTGTGTVTIAVRPSTAKLTIAGGATTITESKLVVLLADELALNEASYTGTIGGKNVSLVRGDDGKSLIFATPEGLSVGTQTLTVKIGTRSFDFPLTATAAPIASDPRGIVLAYLTKSRDDARAFLTANAASLNATARDDITTKVSNIETAINGIGTAPDSDLRAMAIYLQANGLIQGGTVIAIASRTANNVASSATRAMAESQMTNDQLCDAYANTFLIGVFAAVGAANSKRGQRAAVGQVHADPVPADRARRDVAVAPFMVQPSAALHRDGLAVERQRAAGLKLRLAVVATRVARPRSLARHPGVALQQQRLRGGAFQVEREAGAVAGDAGEVAAQHGCSGGRTG